MFYYLTFGTILGLSAGFAPGPLLTLVIAETLQYGLKPGIKIALAPMITDLPIILLALFIFKKISHVNEFLGIISLLGAMFVLFLSYKNFTAKHISHRQLPPTPNSLVKGIVVNALSPHPYLFWFTVGAPAVIAATGQGPCSPFLFIVSFYMLLVGSKLLLAFLVSKSRSFLSGSLYSKIMKMLGLLLVIFAFFLLRDGLTLLGINSL